MADVTVRQPVPLRTVPGVELAAVGTWKASTGETTFTPEDFVNAVAALECPGVRNPVIKLGHDEQDSTGGVRWDGEPAVGWVANMRFDADGKIRGDLTGMPSWLADADENGLSVLAAAYPDRSIEIRRPFVCQIGHEHPSVITALSLLGVYAPGVGVLKSMQDVYAAFTEPTPGTVTLTSATAPGAIGTTVRLAAAERRDPTEVEQRATTDFAALDRTWQDGLDGLLASWPDVSAAQRDELAAQVAAAVDDNPDSLGDLTVDSAAASALILAALGTAAAAGSAEQVAEARRQGLTVVPVEPDDAALAAVAAAVAATMAAGTAAFAGRTAAQLLGTGSGAEVAAATAGKLADLGDRFLRDQLGGALSAAIMHGRVSALRTLPTGRYYASEIADARACAPCLSIDGKEFADLDAAESAYGSGKYTGCLAGARCRGQLVTVWDSTQAGAAGVSTPRDPDSAAIRPGARQSNSHGPRSGERIAITVRASIGDTMPTPGAVKASVSVEDISRKYYESAGYSMWITAMHVDPLELIASDDSNGKFFRIPVELKGDQFTFGDPQEVAIVYEDVKTAASALPYRWADRRAALAAAGKAQDGTDLAPEGGSGGNARATQVTLTPPIARDVTPAGAAIRKMATATQTPDATPAAGSTTTGKEASGMAVDPTKLRDALGLAADASDEDVRAALASAVPETPQGTGGQSDPAAMLSAIPKDGNAILLDRDNYAALVALAKRGDQAYEAMKRGERDTFLQTACKEGRFPVSRLTAYQEMWDRNPDETRAYVELMPRNSVPVVAAGSYGVDVDLSEADRAYEAVYGKGI